MMMGTMPCWYFEKRELRHTVSIDDGMTYEQETQFRREGARFILQVGNKMGLRYETMATGIVYFHRFYMVHTFQQFPRHVTACCCLFLAGKVEETPKKCRDIMKTAKGLMSDTTWTEFGVDPREEVMTLERILLQTIKFDFIVEHPYSHLLKYAKCLKGDKKKLHSMVQMAWTFVNDSLCTTLCLQWEPEIIAIALMYLAGKLSKFVVTDWAGKTANQSQWWELYVEGISMELLEDICHQVLDLYSSNMSEAASSSASTKESAVKTESPAKKSTPTVTAGASHKSSTPLKSTTHSTSTPSAKKVKKEEVKESPVKTVTETPQPQASQATYQYPYNYSTYPPNFPIPSSTAAVPTAVPPPRYSYSYPPSANQQAPPSTVPPLPGYQPPPTHYPPPSASSGPPPPPLPAQTSTSHYTSQSAPGSQYSSPQPMSSYRPPPNPPTHYPPPSTSQPPPSHYPSQPQPHSSSSSSSYYPVPSSGSAGSSGSYPPQHGGHPPSSYPPQSYSHSGSRQYYPPVNP